LEAGILVEKHSFLFSEFLLSTFPISAFQHFSISAFQHFSFS